MKNVRIGNDINVLWQFLNNGQPFNLEGKDVTIYLSCTYERVKVNEFSISENTITWVFKGKEQKYTGKYSLELVLNDGKDGMVTTDARKFVNLVRHCCNNEGFDEPNFITTTINLESNVVYMAAVVDDELSEDSANAISNRAVTAALKEVASNMYMTEFSVLDILMSIDNNGGELIVNKAPLVDAIRNNKIIAIPIYPNSGESGGTIADVMALEDGFEISVNALGGVIIEFAGYYDYPDDPSDKITLMVSNHYRIQERIEDLDEIREGASKGATSAALSYVDERIQQLDAKIEESIIGALNTEV